MTEQIGEKIVATGTEPETRFGQLLAQGFLVDSLVFQLQLYGIGETVYLLQQPFVATAGIGIEIEVAAVDDGMDGVAACQDIDIGIADTIETLLCLNSEIADVALNVVVVFQVGTQREI